MSADAGGPRAEVPSAFARAAARPGHPTGDALRSSTGGGLSGGTGASAHQGTGPAPLNREQVLALKAHAFDRLLANLPTVSNPFNGDDAEVERAQAILNMPVPDV